MSQNDELKQREKPERKSIRSQVKRRLSLQTAVRSFQTKMNLGSSSTCHRLVN